MDDARALGRRPLLAVLAALVVATAVWLIAANAFGASGSGDRPATSSGVAKAKADTSKASALRARSGSAAKGDEDCPFKGDEGAAFDASDV